MPEYTYKCNKCGHTFDIVHSIKEKALKKCTKCKKLALERVITSVLGFVKLAHSEIKQLGHYASRNSEKMSDDQKNMLAAKHKTKKRNVLEEKGFKVVKPKKEKPLFVDDGVDVEKLANATNEQKVNYIEKGIKP